MTPDNKACILIYWFCSTNHELLKTLNSKKSNDEKKDYLESNWNIPKEYISDDCLNAVADYELLFDAFEATATRACGSGACWKTTKDDFPLEVATWVFREQSA